MKSSLWIAYQSNVRQSRPTNNRENYYWLRHHTRKLRTHSPTHYDVSWYADSLGIEPWSDQVVRRVVDGGRVSASGITGPVGKLP